MSKSKRKPKCMTVGDLKKFIQDNKIPDTAVLRYIHPDTMEYIEILEVESFQDPEENFWSVDLDPLSYED